MFLQKRIAHEMMLFFIPVAGRFGFSSNRGVIDITEGIEYGNILRSTGFSYSTVPIRVYTLSYSEYAARGFNLEDTIDSSVIPANPASG